MSGRLVHGLLEGAGGFSPVPLNRKVARHTVTSHRFIPRLAFAHLQIAAQTLIQEK